MTAHSQGFRHADLLYGSTEELLATAVPFLSEGLAAGEAVVLACREEHNRLLTDALGDDRITSLDPATIYARLTLAYAAQRRMIRQQLAAGAPRLRLLVEVPVGDGPDGWAELARYEAACNIALTPLPLSGVCAYDRRHTPEPVLRQAEQTHPALLTVDGPAPNRHYTDPATVLRRTTSGRPDPLEATSPAMSAEHLTDGARLPALRGQLRDLLEQPGRHWHRRTDFASAAAEVLANAFRHGRPPISLRLWTTPTRLVCTVTDQGPGFDATQAGYLPPRDATGSAGAGLWLVRQSCDVLETRRSSAGFTVRLSTSLPPEDLPANTEPRTARAEAAAIRADRARDRAQALRRSLIRRADDAAARQLAQAESAASLARLHDQLRRRQG